MLSLGREETGRFVVYTPRDRDSSRAEPAAEEEQRFFLKAEDNGYIEFGEQKYHQDQAGPQ